LTRGLKKIKKKWSKNRGKADGNQKPRLQV